jgi:hypothetical protein
LHIPKQCCLLKTIKNAGDENMTEKKQARQETPLSDDVDQPEQEELTSPALRCRHPAFFNGTLVTGSIPVIKRQFL